MRASSTQSWDARHSISALVKILVIAKQPPSLEKNLEGIHKLTQDYSPEVMPYLLLSIMVMTRVTRVIPGLLHVPIRVQKTDLGRT